MPSELSDEQHVALGMINYELRDWRQSARTRRREVADRDQRHVPIVGDAQDLLLRAPFGHHDLCPPAMSGEPLLDLRANLEVQIVRRFGQAIMHMRAAIPASRKLSDGAVQFLTGT